MERMTTAGQYYIWSSAIASVNAAMVLTTAVVAQAAPLEAFRYDVRSNQLTFVLPEGVEPRYFLMAQPARIIIDIPDAQIGELPAEQTFSGAVQRVSLSQVQPQLVRAILEMSPQAVFARGQVQLENVGDASPGKDRWVVRPLLAKSVATQPKPASIVPQADQEPEKPSLIASVEPSVVSEPKVITPRLEQASEKPSSVPRVENSVPPLPAVITPKVEPQAVPLEVNQAAATPTAQPMEVVLPQRSAMPPMETPVATVLTTPASSEQPTFIGRATAPIPVKPAPAVELPPGMESVVNTPPLPETPVSPKLSKTLPAKPEPAVKVAVPLPNLSLSIAPTSAVEAVPVNVPLAQLPEESPVSSQISVNVPPPPPLFQAGITNRTGETAAVPNPNSPAALVTPKPVLRPDLQAPDVRRSGKRPTVAVPPLSSLGVSSGNARPIAPTRPPLPETSISQAAKQQAVKVAKNSPPPAASITVPTNQSGMFASRQPTAQPDLPPLPQISPRADINDRSPTAVLPTAPVAQSPLFRNISTPATAVLPVRATTQPETGVVEFGQRLPTSSQSGQPAPRQQSNLGRSSGATVVALDNLSTGGLVVPAGTRLSLRYDQEQVLQLKPGERQPSILRLQSPIVDTRGRVIAAVGTPVWGEFATSRDGSQFTAQSLATFSQNLPLNARSDIFQPSKRVSNSKLLQNSGIGAVAGAVLGGLNGSVLGGAAVGAAITYATSPKQTTLQPGQVFQVQLMQDFFSAR